MGNDKPTNFDFQENCRKEYEVVASSWKFFVSLRFIVVGFAVTFNSGLLAFYTQVLQTAPQLYRIAVALIGFYIVVALWVIERRTIKLFRTMIERGKEMEFLLGSTSGHFQRLSTTELVRPPGLERVMTHTVGIHLFYFLLYILWLTLFALAIKN